MDFIGRFRGNDRGGSMRRVDSAQLHTCTCSQDNKNELSEESRIAGDDEPETEEEKREREKREAAERSQQNDDLHTPLHHPHIAGEAYGIVQAGPLGDQRSAMDRFLDGVKKKYRRK